MALLKLIADFVAYGRGNESLASSNTGDCAKPVTNMQMIVKKMQQVLKKEKRKGKETFPKLLFLIWDASLSIFSCVKNPANQARQSNSQLMKDKGKQHID